MSNTSSKSAWIWLVLILGVGAIGMGSAWWMYGKKLAQRPSANERDAKKGELPVYGDVADFAFANFDGREITRSSLRGKVWVVDFIFTTCTGLCPVMTGAMRQVQERTKARISADDLRLVSITTDPEVDTRERLAEYAEKFGADAARWHIVRGEFKDVQRFSQNALKLGLERATKTQVDAGSEKIIHSNKFVLIDRDGKIRGIYSGTDDAEVDELIRDVPKLLKRASDDDEREERRG